MTNGTVFSIFFGRDPHAHIHVLEQSFIAVKMFAKYLLMMSLAVRPRARTDHLAAS